MGREKKERLLVVGKHFHDKDVSRGGNTRRLNYRLRACSFAMKTCNCLVMKAVRPKIEQVLYCVGAGQVLALFQTLAVPAGARGWGGGGGGGEGGQ